MCCSMRVHTEKWTNNQIHTIKGYLTAVLRCSRVRAQEGGNVAYWENIHTQRASFKPELWCCKPWRTQCQPINRSNCEAKTCVYSCLFYMRTLRIGTDIQGYIFFSKFDLHVVRQPPSRSFQENTFDYLIHFSFCIPAYCFVASTMILFLI